MIIPGFVSSKLQLPVETFASERFEDDKRGYNRLPDGTKL